MAKLKAKRRLGKGRKLCQTPDKKNLPAVATDGQIMMSAGRYARNAVLAVFETLGGATGMATWAETNKTDFYTKLFPKTITREIEDAKTAETIEDLLMKAEEKIAADKAEAIDTEFEDVT